MVIPNMISGPCQEGLGLVGNNIQYKAVRPIRHNDLAEARLASAAHAHASLTTSLR